MIDLDKLIERKPHLKDALYLYKKILRLKALVPEVDATLPAIMPYNKEELEKLINIFSEAFDIPEDTLNPVREAFSSGLIDLSRLPMGEIPHFVLPYSEEEAMNILYLLSKPYFLAVSRKFNLDNIFWTDGKCPVCNSTPSISSIEIASIDKDGKRLFYCSFCETKGQWKRIGCPGCLNADTERLNIVYLEGEDGFRADTCDVCNLYFKTADSYLLRNLTPDLVDLVSLPLDIIAQDRGYRRLSPNPIGMVRMASS